MATLWTDCALGCSSWFVILLHSLLHPWFSHWVWDKPAVCLFVHLRVGFCFFCLFLGAEVLSTASLLHRPPPHCVLTSSWDCQLLHKKLMRLLMVRNHLSILLSTYQIQCGDELKWQLWLRWSDRLLSETVWHSQSEALNECRHQPPRFSPSCTGFWLLPFYWPPICPACFLVS